MTALRDALLAAIEAANLNTRDLAERSGVSEHTLYRYGVGDRSPTSETARKLAKAIREHLRDAEKAAARLERLCK